MKEIMIRMTEKQYDALPEMPLVTLHSIIRNGQILPSGHGRLIDADALEKDAEYDFYSDSYTAYSQNEIAFAETIVEADCDNDCEHCDWVTCPKAEEGAEE